MNEGYVLIGLGKKYEVMANNLKKTLRHMGDERPVKIITEIPKHHLYQRAKTEFERRGTIPKLLLAKDPPFEHTIFLDADVLCCGDTGHVWDFFRSSHQPIQMMGQSYEFSADKDRIKFRSAYQHAIAAPRVHGGCIYFNRSRLENAYFKYMKRVFENFGTKEFFKGVPKGYKNSRTDQAIYAALFAKEEWNIHSIHNQPIISIYDDPTTPLPLRQVKFFQQKKFWLNTDIPFLHIFSGGNDKVNTLAYKHLMMYAKTHSKRNVKNEYQ